MVHVIKCTVDIYCFLQKNLFETPQQHLLFQAASGFFKQIEKLLHLLQKISLIENPDPPSKESWAKTRPSGSENVRIPKELVKLGID